MKYINKVLCLIFLFYLQNAGAYTLCTSNPADGSSFMYCVSISGPGIPETEEIKKRDDATYLTVKNGQFSVKADSRGYVYSDGGYYWTVRNSSNVWVSGTNKPVGAITLAPATEYQLRHVEGGASIYIKVENADEGYWFNSKGELTEWHCFSNVQPIGDGWVHVTTSPSCFHRLVTSYYYSGLYSSYLHKQCGVRPTGKGWALANDGCYHRLIKNYY